MLLMQVAVHQYGSKAKPPHLPFSPLPHCCPRTTSHWNCPTYNLKYLWNRLLPLCIFSTTQDLTETVSPSPWPDLCCYPVSCEPFLSAQLSVSHWPWAHFMSGWEVVSKLAPCGTVLWNSSIFLVWDIFNLCNKNSFCLGMGGVPFRHSQFLVLKNKPEMYRETCLAS